MIYLVYNKNLLGSCLDKIFSSSNGDIDSTSICIHEAVQDVIIDRVNIPPPVPTINVVGNISRTLTNAMRRALADSINLEHLSIRSMDFTSYYSRLQTQLQSRFNMRLVPVISDGNCLFRALSHIIFGDESEHNNVRLSLINSFSQSHYVPAFCGIQGYNELSIQRHFDAMRRNYT